MHLQPNVAANLIVAAIQVSLISVATMACYLVMRRDDLRANKPLLLAGLSLITVATLAIWLPLPSWFDSDNGEAREAAALALKLESQLEAAAKDRKESTQPRPSTTPTTTDTKDHADDTAAEFGWKAYLSRTVDTAQEGLAPPDEVSSVAWRNYIVGGYLLCVALASIKLFGSWVWLVVHSRAARNIQSGPARVALDELCQKLGCQRHVELRESSRLTTPAACGRRTPQILLPSDWQSWSAPQTRAILAHELTHIQQHDYESTLFAQFTLVLHFFNPLVHWLVAALRMEQEYEADRVGANYAIDRQGYLTTLATMALQNDRRRTGLASPFLPNRDSFFRRIEMLKKNRQSSSGTSTRLRKSLVAMPIIIASIATLGLRLPTAFAETKKDREPFDTRFVTGENGMVVAMRPKVLFELPGFDQMAELFRGSMGPLKNSPVDPEDIERIIVSTSTRELEIPEKYQREGQPKTMSVPDKTAFYIRTSSNIESGDFDPMFPMFPFKQEGSDASHLGKSYRKVEYKEKFFQQEGRETLFSMARWQPSKRSVVVSTEESIKRIIEGRTQSPATLKSSYWKDASKSIVAFAIDSTMIESMRKGMEQGKDLDPMANLAAEVFKDVDSIIGHTDIPDDIHIKAILICKSNEGAETAAKTIKEMLTFGRMMLTMQKTENMAAQVDLGKKLLADIKVGAKGKAVHLSLRADYDEIVLGPIFEMMNAAKSAAVRTSSVNNMKQLGLAFHNYAAANKEFPTAVVVGPNGHPHSWRVAILQYTEAADLYNEYRFEEAWDSPHNKKLIDKMPDVYRHPDDPENSTSSRYYTFVGPGTIMGGETGLGFRDVRDGTSKTILYVEAKRDFPWTQPMDIEYSPDNPPDLKGSFNATFADGSVRYIDETVDAAQLHKMIQINDEADAAAANPEAPALTELNEQVEELKRLQGN